MEELSVTVSRFWQMLTFQKASLWNRTRCVLVIYGVDFARGCS